MIYTFQRKGLLQPECFVFSYQFVLVADPSRGRRHFQCCNSFICCTLAHVQVATSKKKTFSHVRIGPGESHTWSQTSIQQTCARTRVPWGVSSCVATNLHMSSPTAAYRDNSCSMYSTPGFFHHILQHWRVSVISSEPRLFIIVSA